MQLRLIRIESNQGMFGILHVPERGALYTVEQPWNATEEFPYGVPSKSCVPPGVYELVKSYSPSRRGDMYYLVGDGVTLRQTDSRTKRWGCMFHIANWPHEVEGCVGPGLSYDAKNRSVKRSGLALSQLTAWLDAAKGPHTLSIEDISGQEAAA